MHEVYPRHFELCLVIEALALPNIRKPEEIGIYRRGKKGHRSLIDWTINQGWELPTTVLEILRANCEGRNPRRLSQAEKKAGEVQLEGIEVVLNSDGNIRVVDGEEAEAVRESRQKRKAKKVCKTSSMPSQRQTLTK